MVFSSHLFLFYFLLLALGLYYTAHKFGGNTLKHLVLTGVSYLFYGWANPLFVLLMAWSTLIDYICGLVIAGGQAAELPKGEPRSRAQKIALTVSILSNLSLLAFFKYFNFGIDTFTALGLTGVQDSVMRITLPLGISFYTFQSMSYSIDVFRGDAKAIRNPIDFACYVSMFPQLVAGPIIRFSEVAQQLVHRTHTLEKFSRGVAFFAMGMAKKILLANPCGWIADQAFNAGSVGFVDAWFGVTAYSMQIYYDFSGYTDMAIGLGLMLGFVFPKNFDSPYISQSITEFWRRWHISLSSWLRDYLYIPLGGNRKGTVRTYIYLALVMLLGGLWHGASWNFVVWGAIHGAMLAFERFQGKDSFYRALPRVGKIVITYVIVLFTWVFFRADTTGDAFTYVLSMLGMGDTSAGSALIGAAMYKPYYLLHFAIAVGIAFFGTQTWNFTRKITPAKAVFIFVLFLYAVLVMTTQSFNPFIYFKF